MNHLVRLCLVLHNHQPVGNFSHVIESAFHDSYLPFLDVWERYPGIKLTLHMSGPLLDWLDSNQPAYLDRIASAVIDGRLELLGGADYEAILPMLPRRDRRSQLQAMSHRLQERFGAGVRGIWVPERVWEADLVTDLADVGIEYTILDDFHFRQAGLEPESLHGYYLTEDQGRLLRVLPGSEPLRYMIPFRPVHEVIDHLRQLATRHPGAIAVFGDDGEKFGSWPQTKAHVYGTSGADRGWLESFFEALQEHESWLQTSTTSEALDAHRPIGKIYLPEASYREMTEWALPTQRQVDLDHWFPREAETSEIPYRSIVRGGTWRNFKVKYPETDLMYSRMMFVSRRLARLEADGHRDPRLEAARRHLHRGQCNCPYWHGSFGGVYLPHLRQAIYAELIRAEHCIDDYLGIESDTVDAFVGDFDYDGQSEVRLANSRLMIWLAPDKGGQLYELDIRSIQHNVLATLKPRPEPYHSDGTAIRSEAAGSEPSGQESVDNQTSASVKRFHDGPLRSLIDRLWAPATGLEDVMSDTAAAWGTFFCSPFQTQIRRGDGRIQVLMHATSVVEGHPITLRKAVTQFAESEKLEIVMFFEYLPPELTFRYGLEWNFAGLPAGLEDRFFHDQDGQRFGHLGTRLDLPSQGNLGLTDEWLGLDMVLTAPETTGWWTYPVSTRSRSEAGPEDVHQSVTVIPHWLVRGDERGRWSCHLTVDFDTTIARNRMEHSLASYVQ